MFPELHLMFFEMQKMFPELDQMFFFEIQKIFPKIMHKIFPRIYQISHENCKKNSEIHKIFRKINNLFSEIHKIFL